MPDTHRPAPLLSPLGMAIALAAALLLGWPMLATGDYLIFADTSSYIRGGEIIWRMITDMLSAGGEAGLLPGGGAGDAGGALPAEDGSMKNDRGEPYVVRSFVYSLYTLVSGAAIWPAGFAILQAAMTLWMLFALIGPEAARQPRVLAAGFLYLAALTTLPWFTVYLMPDLLAAAVLIYAAILMRRFDDLVPWQRLAIGAITAFAVAAHYGHPPLAAGLLGAVLLWRLVTRRLTLAVFLAGILPVLFSPLANLSASSVALDTPSVAPLRLPILLARSIQDGPARWYLEDACPQADLVFCEAFGEEIPWGIDAFLWREGGIDSLTPEQMAGIRDEEYEILWRAFLAYPVEQSVSLFGNTAKQIVRVGTGGIRAARYDGTGFDREAAPPRAEPVIDVFDTVTPVATWAAVALLAGLALSGRLTRGQIEVVAAVIAGLLLNAVIFGGLSAPVDRYQSRVIWVLPALAGIYLADWLGRRDPG